MFVTGVMQQPFSPVFHVGVPFSDWLPQCFPGNLSNLHGDGVNDDKP